MARKVVAVEEALVPVQDYLRGKGYRVVGLDADLARVDAVVVRGSDVDALGRQDVLTPAPVIEAAGLTPEEVDREIQRRTVR